MSRQIEYTVGANCTKNQHNACSVAWLAFGNMRVCECECHMEVSKESFNRTYTYRIPVLSGDRIVRVDNYQKPE